MVLQMYQLTLIPICLYVLYHLYRYHKLSVRRKDFPPGPTPLPIIGNLHQIPISRPELRFATYAKEYGPITGLQLGSHNMIVLNTWEAVHDLIEQKGGSYSSRPKLAVTDVIVPGGLNPAFNKHGELWRKQRKLMVEFLGGDRTDAMKPVQDAESTQMIYDIMFAAENFEDHVLRSFGSVILETVYGQRENTFKPGGKLARFFEVEEEWAAAVGATASPPIQSFPFLESVPDWATPWKGWRRRAAKVKKAQKGLYLGLLRETKERLAVGKGVDSFMARCLKIQDKEWYDDLYLAYCGGILMEGGIETSASTTMVFILAMAAFPDTMKRAQFEVDTTCGLKRLPGKDDIPNLPYVRACMLEVLRWRPIIPLAVPHTTSAEDTYKGYTIPTNTDVIINAWNIHQDGLFFQDPATFNPARYLENERGGLPRTPAASEYKGRKSVYSFGAGRRVCPGQRFAENALIISFAKLAWAFDIEPTGPLAIDTWDDWTDGLVTRPKNLNVRFKLRDHGRRKVIEEAWGELTCSCVNMKMEWSNMAPISLVL
ncbi:cytochrome P450 [Clohesyomyces aquaticus]|uniref:Cytochrome P450 n=1 Tax=Clohesyomyces aquaticus TaxID=1231657 RepID=A0A1Y1YHP6_9PLEO|nr:cytochrome P450 [Clohesyomyces aquaticus]